ncbi:MAG: hypothetical protein ACI39Q_06460 [Wujia sp.]
MSERTGRNMYYVEGSTVRKIDTAPEREYVPERRRKAAPERQERRERRVNAKVDRALAFDMRYTVFVVSSVLIMVCACLMMLYMESKIDAQQRNINNMEAQLENIENDNAAYEMSLKNMYTLDDIYDVAANELGMVYAKKGQIVYYESANEDYVTQYQDVPEAN